MVLKKIRSGRASLRIGLILLLSGLPLSDTFSQEVDRIDIERIPQRKVRKFITSRSIDQITDFSSLHSSWRNDTIESDYNVVENTFYLKFDLNEVWNCYMHTDPVKMWTCKSVRFELLISKSEDSVVYAGSSYCGDADTGQIYFLNLRVMLGVINVPVAFEIVTIDPSKKVMEFSYIEGNKSLGKQTIQFFDNGVGQTRIMHRSFFRSTSKLRDKLFYPHFHTKLVKDFHQNMNQLLRKKKDPLVMQEFRSFRFYFI